MRKVRDYLVYLIVRLFVCLVQTLSLDACHRVSAWLAWLANDVIRLRHGVILSNLATAFPQLSLPEQHRLARAMWEHLFLMVCEIAHAPRKIHDTNWRDYISFRNDAAMIRFFWAERPKVFVGGHFGNFELASYTMGIFGFETYAVARTLDNSYLDRYIRAFRESRGQHILAKQGSADEIRDLLAHWRTLSVLGDQAAGAKGCWVEFFGAPASTHKAVSLFSLANNAPLAVGYARRLDEPLHYQMALEAIFDPATAPLEQRGLVELSQWFTSHLEQFVLEAPEQYWWVHRRWKGEPPARARRSQAA